MSEQLEFIVVKGKYERKFELNIYKDQTFDALRKVLKEGMEISECFSKSMSLKEDDIFPEKFALIGSLIKAHDKVYIVDASDPDLLSGIAPAAKVEEAKLSEPKKKPFIEVEEKKRQYFEGSNNKAGNQANIPQSEAELALQYQVQKSAIFKGLILKEDGKLKYSLKNVREEPGADKWSQFMKERRLDCFDQEELEENTTENIKEFHSILSGASANDIKFKIPRIFEICHMTSEKQMKSTEVSQREMITYRIKSVPKIQIHLYEEDPLEPEFQNYFNKRQVNWENLCKFYDCYGHFVPSKILFGGRFCAYISSTITEQTNKQTLKKDMSVALGGSFEKISKGTLKIGQADGHESANQNSSSEKKLFAQMTSRGGVSNDNYEAWLGSLSDQKYWKVYSYEDLIDTVSFLSKDIQEQIKDLLQTRAKQLEKVRADTQVMEKIQREKDEIAQKEKDLAEKVGKLEEREKLRAEGRRLCSHCKCIAYKDQIYKSFDNDKELAVYQKATSMVPLGNVVERLVSSTFGNYCVCGHTEADHY